MQKKEIRRSVRESRFCSDNPRCTNENKPKQGRSILDYIRNQVRLDPAGYGYTGEGEAGGLEEFEKDWKAITGACIECHCIGGC